MNQNGIFLSAPLFYVYPKRCHVADIVFDLLEKCRLHTLVADWAIEMSYVFQLLIGQSKWLNRIRNYYNNIWLSSVNTFLKRDTVPCAYFSVLNARLINLQFHHFAKPTLK